MVRKFLSQRRGGAEDAELLFEGYVSSRDKRAVFILSERRKASGGKHFSSPLRLCASARGKFEINSFVSKSAGSSLIRIERAAVSAARMAVSLVSAEAMMLPHFVTLFSGKETLLPFAIRRKRSLTWFTVLAFSMPTICLTVPGMEIKALSAHVHFLIGTSPSGFRPIAARMAPLIGNAPDE